MQQGWIKLHRDLLDKPIWLESTPEQKTILITLLMMANHQGKQWEWKGEIYEIKPGQFITSLESIAHKCGKGISVQNVRTSLKRFEKYKFLTNKSTNKNRLITLINWGVYQGSDSELTNKLTGNQQATNKQLTTNKNVKNEENEKEKDNTPFSEIIKHLNEKTGKRFSPKSASNQKLIKARFNEGRTLEDFIQVIDTKCQEWLSNEEMSKYLQPSTLFRESNFEKYLNQVAAIKSVSSVDPRDHEIALNKFLALGGDPDNADEFEEWMKTRG
ncbi:conserved phage C-terminal domain-containing protein [Bacillus sp. LL01]|uniref:conserved phage C-terminal domain-containing protein n=1 Tax=Bacillus sp. LL01 TaxID=1665556 RepID=UPI00069FF529|nr:conserved phage C-terminal domain-containing protein [Bacillus sp. LL01]